MITAALFALLFAGTQELMIPEGTILPVVLNETLNTAKVQENDPILLTLADDLHMAGHRGPVLIPRGSNVVGRIVKSDRAGHFFGRSSMDIKVQEIVTPTGIVYDGLSAKVIDIGKKKGEKGEVKADGVVQGPVHRTRDTILLLFPPTTVFQLMATPKRGPDVILPVETRISVKLMSPIYVQVANPAVAPTQPLSLPQFPSPVQPSLSPSSLDILVSPVALYPDAILRDLLVASTHPTQVVQANQWVHQPRDIAGGLPYLGYNDAWDPSVKAMTAYPDLLQRLGSDYEWVSRLGTAVASQPSDLMSAVQRVRTQAQSLRRPATPVVVPIGY
jgi:hypothetical protein